MDLFFSAIEENDIKKIKAMVHGGVDINVKDEYGYSALHITSYRNLVELAILLINMNIDLNIKDKNGQTALHYFALNNQLELAKFALEKGAYISSEDIYGNQPLWTAVFNDKGRDDRIEIIKMYINYGADKRHKNKSGKSPEDIASIAGYKNISKLF